MHYSCVSTDKKIMVLDLQGVDYNLCDPEIATMDLLNEGELNFFTGNLSTQAIEGIFSSHNCNQYCKMMKINGQYSS